MLDNYYSTILYPFQDKILKLVESCETPFYLTGGIAFSRCYFHHRFSDNLYFNWQDIIQDAFSKDSWVNTIDVIDSLLKFDTEKLKNINWIYNFDFTKTKDLIQIITTDISKGRKNNLYQTIIF